MSDADLADRAITLLVSSDVFDEVAPKLIGFNDAQLAMIFRFARGMSRAARTRYLSEIARRLPRDSIDRDIALARNSRPIGRPCNSVRILFSVDTLVHAEQFLGLDAASITKSTACHQSGITNSETLSAGQSELKYSAARFIRLCPQPSTMGVDD
jgi:hypothetical protein